MRALKILLIFVFLLPSATILSKDNNSKKEQGVLSSKTFAGLKLRCIGPALTSGRVTDFAVNPNNPAEFYVASASGGVWKTENDGTSWTPVFDKEGSYSIGCIAMDPNNHFVIWVGTGENNSQRSVSYGDGVYLSKDGGKTWKNMGLKSSEHIGKIIIDPKNSNIVYVAAQGPLWGPGGDRGLYKTTDAGKTWKAVLTISKNTGVNEVIMDPRNPDVLYASSYQRRRHTWTLIDGGPESAIYKSTDAGVTWEKLKNGIPNVDKGRIGLAISPVNPDVVYAIIEAANGKGGFFRSTDRGASWKKQSSYMTTSPQYYNEIVCDPKDVDRVYAFDTHMHYTDDGGKTFKRLSEKNKHVDNHAMWIDPKNTNHYLVGCDGGVYESWDRAANWQFKSNLPITQFYNVAVDNSKPFYYVYGGTQDNNSLGGPSQTKNVNGIVNSDWFITNGGDGFVSRVDPQNPDIVYAESQYGGLVRYDRKSGEIMDIQPQPGKNEAPLRLNWDSPLIISPHSHTHLYFAANKLFESTDRGNTWKEISGDLTRQIDRNKLSIMGRVWSMDAVSKNASTSYFGNIVALSESPVKAGLLYAGTDDGLINVTKNDGKSWTRIKSFSGVPDTSYVSYIFASNFDSNTVYASFDNHKRSDFKPYILKSTDAGKTWKSIVGNLPENYYVHAIVEDFKDPNLLFAGTEFGVFFTIDGGKNWIELKGNMPTIAVRDIAIQKRENDLVLATFGRGFYILDNYSPLRKVSKKELSNEAAIYPIKDALMYIPSFPLGGSGKASQGESFYTASNPPFGATFTYYLKEDIKTKKELRQDKEKKLIKEGKPVPFPSNKEITEEDEESAPYLLFTIKDEAGNVVRKLKAPAKSGIHRISWNLRYASTNPLNLKKPDDEESLADYNSGILASPGVYSVIMSKVADGVLTKIAGPQLFKAKILDETTLPAENRSALLSFQKKVADLNRAVMGSLQAADNLAKNIKYAKEALLKSPAATNELRIKADSIQKETENLLIKLRGNRSLMGRSINTPPSIVGRVQQIVYGEWMSTSAPTQTQKVNYKIAASEFKPVLTQLKTLVGVDFRELQEQLEKVGAPWTPGRVPEWKDE